MPADRTFVLQSFGDHLINLHRWAAAIWPGAARLFYHAVESGFGDARSGLFKRWKELTCMTKFEDLCFNHITSLDLEELSRHTHRTSLDKDTVRKILYSVEHRLANSYQIWCKIAPEFISMSEVSYLFHHLALPVLENALELLVPTMIHCIPWKDDHPAMVWLHCGGHQMALITIHPSAPLICYFHSKQSNPEVIRYILKSRNQLDSYRHSPLTERIPEHDMIKYQWMIATIGAFARGQSDVFLDVYRDSGLHKTKFLCKA